MSTEPSKSDIREFRGFCQNASDAQLQGIFEKENGAGRHTYAEIARGEAQKRGVEIEEPEEDDDEEDEERGPSGDFVFYVPVYVTVEDGQVTGVTVDDTIDPKDEAARVRLMDDDKTGDEAADKAALGALLDAALDGQSWPSWGWV